MDDAGFASNAGRVARRDEFLEIVNGWAAQHTTAEIEELAAALRIPVAPIGTPDTITEFPHFRERGVFVEDAAGHLQPRIPYRTDGFASAPADKAPLIGSGPVETWRQPSWAGQVNEAGAASTTRPLDGVRIVDLTAFWAGPTAAFVLGALGADVIKLEGLRRPDGMRFSIASMSPSAEWWEWSPIFLASNNNKRGVVLELSKPRGREIALELIAGSDVVIENFSPRVMGNLGLEWDDISNVNPSAVMTRMPAFGLDGPWRDRVGFAQTMEQASGLAWMTGPADGAPIIPRGVCDPVAGLHAAFATIIALEARDQSGTGMLIECTMVEAVLNIAAEALIEYSHTGVVLTRDGNRGPDASPQGVFASANEDEWVALAILDDRDWPRLAELVCRPDLATDPDLATEAGRRLRADEIELVISAWIAGQCGIDAVEMLRAAGAAAAVVTSGAELLKDPQLTARRFWEPVTRPIVGTFTAMGLPLRMASVPDAWATRPSPLFGQHTHEVLREHGMDDAEIAELERDGVIGFRPAGT